MAAGPRGCIALQGSRLWRARALFMAKDVTLGHTSAFCTGSRACLKHGLLQQQPPTQVAATVATSVTCTVGRGPLASARAFPRRAAAAARSAPVASGHWDGEPAS